jgi:hypothetical protein
LAFLVIGALCLARSLHGHSSRQAMMPMSGFDDGPLRLAV